MATHSYQPLTAKNWNDFEELFGANGACGGCWCMYWKLKRSEFVAGKGKINKDKQKKLIVKKTIPGIILYADKKPVGWCAIEPRMQYPVMNNSRVLKPIDEKAVWSISCFFISKAYRKQGLSVQLLEFAKQYCKRKKASIVEGYPYDVEKETAAPFVWTGLRNAFIKAGFTEVARHSPVRPIMRFYL